MVVVKDDAAWVLHNVSLHPPLRWAKWPAAVVVVFPSFLSFFLICDLPKEISFVVSLKIFCRVSDNIVFLIFHELK
jgi:hypothetical protein